MGALASLTGLGLMSVMVPMQPPVPPARPDVNAPAAPEAPLAQSAPSVPATPQPAPAVQGAPAALGEGGQAANSPAVQPDRQPASASEGGAPQVPNRPGDAPTAPPVSADPPSVAVTTPSPITPAAEGAARGPVPAPQTPAMDAAAQTDGLAAPAVVAGTEAPDVQPPAGPDNTPELPETDPAAGISIAEASPAPVQPESDAPVTADAAVPMAQADAWSGRVAADLPTASGPGLAPAVGSAGAAAEGVPPSDAPPSDAPPSDVPASDVPASDAPVSENAQQPEATPPQSGLGAGGAGVRVGRLPSISANPADAPSSDTSPAESGAEPGTQVTAPSPRMPGSAVPGVLTPSPAESPGPGQGNSGATPDAPAADAPALVRNARPFLNPDRKPLLSVILIDGGAPSDVRAVLAFGALPVTLALDGMTPRANEIAQEWRAAGQEVLLLGSGLPAGGTAADFEVALESLTRDFPQALGLMDVPNGGFQSDRQRSAALVPALAARGMGLVTWDRGLNSADQIARRDSLPAAMVFRELDAEGENAATIRRYLDRAAFRAAQEGHVIVVGRMRAETVEALVDWSAGGRVDSVAPAPVSAVLTRP